jgi:hypothetical protein
LLDSIGVPQMSAFNHWQSVKTLPRPS